MRYDARWFGAGLVAARDVAAGVREIEIAPDGGALPHAPGSHIDIRVTVNGRPDLRSYSLIGEPQAGLYRIAVKAQERSRGGSLFMGSLAPGDRVEVSAPIDGFELGLAAPAYLLIAGGIGITPLIGMAALLARRGAAFRLLYAGRSRAEMAYLGLLEEMLGERLEIFAGDEAGRIDLRTEIARLAPGGELYLCGPMRLLGEARRLWAEAGRPAPALRYETFGSSGGFAARPFLVELPRLGISVAVAETVTLLDALTEAGVELLSDCRRGECGLCAVEVIEAERPIDHRDVFFSDEERRRGNRICACVSRASGGRLVIDPPYRPD
jgi:vanillate monooxygenase ferredoxin subunit